MGSTGLLFPKLDKLLNEECNMPAGTKVELKSMEKLLDLLLEKYIVIGGVTLGMLGAAKSAWLFHTNKLFCDAEVLVDSLLVPAECSEPTACPDELSENTSSPEITDTEIKKITERGSLLIQLLFKEGKHLRAMYKQEKETELVGIDGPRDELIKMLAEGDDMSEKQLKKVFITGIGGSGKTTLARVVYNQLKPQFDCGAFVRAPGPVHRDTDYFDLHSDTEPFDLRRDTKHFDLHRAFYWEMLSQLDVQNHMNIQKSAIGSGYPFDEIKQVLQNKRYLVVIDDAWDVEGLHWIMQTLLNRVDGSRIIITSHIDNIAEFGLSVLDESVYEVKKLGYIDSRKLFFKQFFVCDASFPNAPTEVLYGIFKMCGGTPAAIISIALLLATRITATKTWEELMNSVYSAWKQMASFIGLESDNSLDFEELRYILLLTYVHLPRPLKKCLLYLNVHAKNQMIHRTSMVRKWIAEEFISAYMVSRCEELANRYFDELIDRNFIHLVEYGNFLGEQIYEVNKTMRNFLRQLSHEENFATVVSDGGPSCEYAKSVRLFIQCSGSELIVHTENMDPFCIRSITIVGPAKFYLTNALVYLRVLDLDGCKDLKNSAMVYICRMILLKYLSLKHTQVSEIPPEIRELQGHLETLVVSQTEIRNLPHEIGKLYNLSTLDASHTKISCLPPEIGLLQNLETLDVRHTLVKELPKELVQLHRLARLYVGQICSPRGVKLPVGSDQLKSVKVFGTVDSREWSGSAMEEISGLTGVRELEVVLHDQHADKDQNDTLLFSIGKCENLKFLIIHGDYNPSDDLHMSPYFSLLEKLIVGGRFVKVPRWLAQLRTLKKLDVRLCNLEQDDLKILGGLPVLSTLALALISISRKKKIVITNWMHSTTCTCSHPQEETCEAGALIPHFGKKEETCGACFTNLEIFNFDCHVPWITFEKGAMLRLKHLHLKLFACPASKFPSGIGNLHSLEKITLRYSSHHASSGGVTKAVAAMREEAYKHPNLIDISVNGEHEVFLSIARVEEAITGTEIEEDSNHGNLFELSVNRHHEVLDTRVDKTITGIEIEKASNHGNLVELSLNGDHEVLLSNTRVGETITGIETKKASNHDNLIDLSVDGDHEVLLPNARVDETITGAQIKECY